MSITSTTATSRATSSLSSVTDTQKLLDTIVDSIQDVKGKKAVRLDLRKLHDRPADYFVICEGESTTQVNAIANRVQRRVRDELGERPKTATGQRNATWVCLDYFNIIVHVFHPEKRAFYDLEDLWSDAEVTEYADA